jgi:hypothetical protein
MQHTAFAFSYRLQYCCTITDPVGISFGLYTLVVFCSFRMEFFVQHVKHFVHHTCGSTPHNTVQQLCSYIITSFHGSVKGRLRLNDCTTRFDPKEMSNLEVTA